MKVIRQIADYLLRSGALSEKQYEALVWKGFIAAPASAAEQAGPPPPEPRRRAERAAPLEPDEAAEVEFDLEWPRRRHPGGRKHHGRVVKAPELRARLTLRLSAWRPVLDPLAKLGRRLAGCGSWPEAVQLIRRAEEGRLVQAVCESLRRRQPSLHELWTALTLEDYRGVIEPGDGGPAIRAFKAIVAGVPLKDLGRHTWLLKTAEVKEVYDLLHAQRTLLAAFYGVLRSQPDLLGRGLRQDFHHLAYWTMILLYSAGRRRNGGYPEPTRAERAPNCFHNEDTVPREAWRYAVLLDYDRMMHFIANATALDEADRARLEALLEKPRQRLSAPQVAGLRDLFLRREHGIQSPRNGSAQAVSLTVAGLLRERLIAQQVEALRADHTFRWISSDDPAQGWRPLLEGWWRERLLWWREQRAPGQAGLALDLPPYKNRILCPRNWEW